MRAVTSGDESGVGVIPGPCQGYDIAGRVLIGNEDLQLVLISWGEAPIAEARAAEGATAPQEKGRTPGDGLSPAVELFGLINTGGGGVDE